MATQTQKKITCKPNIGLLNGQLYTIDDNGNCTPFSITIEGAVGPRGPRGASGVFNIPTLTTAQRLALVPTTAYLVQDSDLDMYFKWSTISNAWSPF